ncbi:MAG: bis(5'-nucleosyl)-tetraphosphatase (symmetrical) YqeK [Lachnospiraceae bacterium]
MNEELINGIKKNLKNSLTKHRMTHTEGVAYTAASLGMRYEMDIEKCYIAGLLHDCAKYVPEDKMIELCKKHNVNITPFEEKSTYLLHGKVGAILAKKDYKISDEDILNAITYHTTGRAGMSMLEKIIFVADYIEPNRREIPNIARIRSMAFIDIDKAIYMIARDTVDYLTQSNRPIDDTTYETMNFYKTEV